MIRPAHSLYVHAGQATVLNHPARFKVVVAGRRWGKTQLSKISIIRAARRAKRLIWYVAPTYRMAKTIMWTELMDALPKAWIVKANETLLEITLKNGTQIHLKGADKPDTLRGVGLHFLVIDEAQDMRSDTWYKVLRPTLASTNGDVLIIGTPKAFNWLYEVYMKGQRGEPDWASWQFPTITSPFIPKGEIDAARNDMDEKSFKQEFEASFETMSGRVYHAFDRARHLADLPFNPDLPIWVGMDFNVDPMSVVIIQVQKNGEVWVVDEIVQPSSSTEEMADELERRYWRQARGMIVYPDPAGANRSHTRGESDLDILIEKGFKRMKYRRKHPRVADRVNAVNRMLCSADGTVRLRISNKCRHLIKALEEVIYKPGTRDVDKSQGIEHVADALGYAIEIEYPVRKVTPIGVSV